MRSSLGIVTSSLLLTALGAPGCALSPSDDAVEAGNTAKVTQALPAPVPGVDITALRAFVGDPLRGIGPGQPGSLYSLAADDSAPMASTTKSFTLLLAVEAVMKGLVSLNDIVTISSKAANVNNNHSGSHSTAGLPAGEQVRFEDLLYAMMMPSGADASIAIAQHVMVKTYPNFAMASDAAQEAAFVGLMNQRAAELGLTRTTFYNPYGGDHIHFDDNTPGGNIGHRTSTRDMARWFDLGMKSVLFRTVAGFQGTYSFNAVDGTAYSFNASFGYPGMRAQKGGSNDGCTSCLVGSAQRIGRDLVVAYTQSQGGDGTTLLDYGFAELFHPRPKAISPAYNGGWSRNSLACVTSQRAASAVVKPDGKMQILVWGLDLDAGSIQHLNPIDSPMALSANVVLSPSPGSGDILYGGPKPVISDARIQYAGSGNLMVVAETNLGVYLYSYGITGENTVVLRDLEYVGAGTDARVQVLHPSLVVTAHRSATGSTTLKTWRLDALTGKLGNPLATNVGGAVAPHELELSGRPGLAHHLHAVLGYRNGQGRRVLQSYDVVRETGVITLKGETVSTSGDPTHLSLTNVPGFGTSRDVYALAFRDSLGLLAVESFDYTPGGSITRLGVTTDTQNGPLAADASIEISAYREGGVMIAAQPNANAAAQRLDVWALDPSGTSSAIVPNRVTSRDIVEDGLHGMCRVSTNAAEGEFLIATGKSGAEGIRLRAFRSGPRQ